MPRQVCLNWELTSFFCVKSKETYYARCQELDKSKKDGSSPKEIEKVSPSDMISVMILTSLQRAHYSMYYWLV